MAADQASPAMWGAGDSYDRFMGRWSQVLAGRMVRSAVGLGAGLDRWLDVGSGTGAVTAAALDAGVGHIDAVEPSPAFVAALTRRFADSPVQVHAASATELPAGPFDVVISSLVLNFTPDPVASLTAMRQAIAPDGRGMVSVWDLSDPRSFLWRFWAAVERVAGEQSEHDERYRWPICTPTGLADVAAAAGWDPAVTVVEIPTPFSDTEDLWLPFLEGAGPVGVWLGSRPESERAAIREALAADMFPSSSVGPSGAVSTALVVHTR